MTLEEKIRTINEPSIADMPDVGFLPGGKADTIEEFFIKFVKPRLPEPGIIKEWHEILMEYTDDKNLSNLSCCVRYGNNGGGKASSSGETGYYKLRRGWLTKNTDDDFEYFFADNFFSSFIYKMALDGFVPKNVDELREIFRQHKFPYGFGFFIDKKVNEYKGAKVAIGKEPGFLGNYKLSHVFDAGECFDINGKKCGDAKLSEDYYPIGHSDDFLKNSDCIRRMKITDDAKKVIVAKFLRFAHPFNYFLTPTNKHHICGQKVYKKDIGEDPRMISYVKQYLKKVYPTEYAQFTKAIMWYDDPKAVVATGKERIDITYGLNVDSAGKTKTQKAPSTPKNLIDLTNITKNYLDTFNVGEIANQVLRAVIESGVSSGKITKAEVDEFKTKQKSNTVFKLFWPLLSVSRETKEEKARYYKKPVDCYGETLYLTKEWYDNRNKSALIQWIIDWVTAHGGKI